MKSKWELLANYERQRVCTQNACEFLTTYLREKKPHLLMVVYNILLFRIQQEQEDAGTTARNLIQQVQEAMDNYELARILDSIKVSLINQPMRYVSGIKSSSFHYLQHILEYSLRMFHAFLLQMVVTVYSTERS